MNNWCRRSTGRASTTRASRPRHPHRAAELQHEERQLDAEWRGLGTCSAGGAAATLSPCGRRSSSATRSVGAHPRRRRRRGRSASGAGPRPRHRSTRSLRWRIGVGLLIRRDPLQHQIDERLTSLVATGLPGSGATARSRFRTEPTTRIVMSTTVPAALTWPVRSRRMSRRPPAGSLREPPPRRAGSERRSERARQLAGWTYLVAASAAQSAAPAAVRRP